MAFNSRRVDLSAKGVDDIWDELTTAHVISSSLGKALDDLRQKMPAGNFYDGGDIALTATGIDEIWNEPDAGHTTGNTPGNTLRLLDNVLPGSTIAAASDLIGLTGHSLSSSGVDAIWNEPDAGHTTGNTPGNTLRLLDNVLPGGTIASVNSAYESSAWVAPASDATANVFGSYVQLFGSVSVESVQVMVQICGISTGDLRAIFAFSEGAATSESDVLDFGFYQLEEGTIVNYSFLWKFTAGARVAVHVKDLATAQVETYEFRMTLLSP